MTSQGDPMEQQLVDLVYVGPFGEVEIDGHYELAVAGEVVQVPAVLAGRPPSGHRADVDSDGLSLFDPGVGLLAQPSNWQPAPAEVVESPAARKARLKQVAAEAAAANLLLEHTTAQAAAAAADRVDEGNGL